MQYEIVDRFTLDQQIVWLICVDELLVTEYS